MCLPCPLCYARSTFTFYSPFAPHVIIGCKYCGNIKLRTDKVPFDIEKSELTNFQYLKGRTK